MKFVEPIRVAEYQEVLPDPPEGACDNDTRNYIEANRDVLWQRLFRFDDEHFRSTRSHVFEFRAKRVFACNIVGVIRTGGLTIEILPKIDAPGGQAGQNPPQAGGAWNLAQHNLLAMLAYTRKLQIVARDIAALDIRKMSLLEVLIHTFATSLLEELVRGVDRSYVAREDNLAFFKGKLLVGHHIRQNPLRRDRFSLGYEEFDADTRINRILLATCRRLLAFSGRSDSLRLLTQAMAHMDGVSDVRILPHHFDNLILNRNNQRFEVLLNFCRMVLLGQSPAPRHGASETFCLLFPMEQLFEEFVATFLRRHCSNPDFMNDGNGGCFCSSEDVFAQGVGVDKKYLVNSEGAGGRRDFRLKPDIIVMGRDANGKAIPRLIVDTKWKCLLDTDRTRARKVAQSDMYQMYAYANRFNCPDVILLYPSMQELEQLSIARSYVIESDEPVGDNAGCVTPAGPGNVPKRIHIRLLPLHYDLLTDSGRKQFGAALVRALDV